MQDCHCCTAKGRARLKARITRLGLAASPGRLLLAGLLLALTVAAMPAARGAAHHALRDAIASALYSWDARLLGRSEAAYPAPRCCADAACATSRTGRVAAVVPLRSDAYLPLLRQLECTLRKSNPGMELVLMHVEGELRDATLEEAAALNLTLLPAPALQFPNFYEPRYGKNWFKLRVWGLAQYDAVVLLDADTVVLQDLAPLWGLPTDFAASWDQSKWLNRHKTVLYGINTGFLFVRPCPEVEAHMLSLLTRHPRLRFEHSIAEQDFLTWYYRYTGMVLPVKYNAQAEQALLPGGLTVGGDPPAVLHFTGQKPWHGAAPDIAGSQFLCSAGELDERRRRGLSGVAPAAG